VAFLQDIPQFVGIDMGCYGPYRAGDIATVPEENAKVLIEKGASELVELGETPRKPL
jgi:DNA replication factor GINS